MQMGRLSVAAPSVGAPLVAPPVVPSPVASVESATPPGGGATTQSALEDKSIAVAKDSNSDDDINSRLTAAGYRPVGEAKTVCFIVKSQAPGVVTDQVHGFFSRHQLLDEEPAQLMFGGEHGAVASGRQFTSAQTNSSKILQLDGTNVNMAPPASEPAVDLVQKRSVISESTAKHATANGISDQVPLSPSTLPVDSLSASTDRVCVAHGLTALQVELLNASLSSDNPDASIQRVTLSQGTPSYAMASQSVSGLINKGQVLTVTVPQLVGPGIDQTNVVKVTDDGTISLPMIDPVPAAGVTTHDLRERIASKYREANLIPHAEVAVTLPPSTQPATNQPTTQANVDTTQPAIAATQPVNPPGIDVVVLIEKAAGK